MSTQRIIKIVVFGALLAGAGGFFGLVLRWADSGWEYLMPPTWDAFYLGVWFIGAVLAGPSPLPYPPWRCSSPGIYR